MSPQKADISVIVPFYNSEEYIEDCVVELLNQDYPSELYEVIMVDNNSTDSSTEILRRYPSVRLVSERKQGSYAARNRGLREARGKIIAFTDSDCAPRRNWLNEIDRTMADPDVGIVVGNNELSRDSFFLSMLEDYENEKNNYVFNSEVKELYYGYTRNMAVRKGLFEEVGQFLEMDRGSDSVFVRRCVDRYSSKFVHYSPEVRVRHMEIDSISKFFRKISIYGSSSRLYSHIVYARPLNSRERFLVFRRTAHKRRYSWVKTISLLGLLALAFVYWNSGRINTSLNFR